MPFAANLSETVTDLHIDRSGNVTVNVEFTDVDDGQMVGANTYSYKLSGGPITDNRGRVVAAAAPANIITPANTWRTNIASAIATAGTAGKLRPA